MADAPGLRPTPDRVRETLFNWLMPYLDGARCLDLFAGTGALGFEALSRGAAQVVFVDRDRDVIRHLREQARLLGAEPVQFVEADAREWLQGASPGFDLVFLDPPFGENLLGGACELLANRGHLRPGALIYMEGEAGTAPICDGYRITRQSRAGRVEFMLLEYRQGK